MNPLWKASPVISFVCCVLGGVILLLNGMDKENGLLFGLGLFCIGVAFYVGPMLGLAIEKRGTKPDDK
jgi:hypothetical protein